MNRHHRSRIPGLRTAALALAWLSGACGSSSDLTQADRVRALLDSEAGEAVELPGGDTLHVGAATLAFYKERGYKPVWTGEETVRDRGQALQRVLAGAERDGLDPEPYRAAVAERLITALAEEEEDLDGPVERQYTAALDVLLTEGFNRYANDLVRGTIDPAEAELDWRIPREKAAADGLLARMAGGEDPEAVLDDVRPRAPEYRRFMEALGRYREVQRRGGWPTLPEDAAAAPGDSGAVVALLRNRLVRSPDPKESELAGRGTARAEVFDEHLEEAVRHFQRRHGIEDDGALGASTLRELNHTVEERIAELTLNMDRWRWLPHELGERYILVNIAGFELEVVENGEVIEAMNVVVGKESWQTPVFTDTMEHLVVNPYWNVPVSIKKDEIIPAVRRDPGYLARNNFEVLRNGRQVHPASVDPEALARYDVRQKPGGSNALGRFKFLFPNKNNIYLHDTPANHLFSRARRDFSHGCIRLERPKDLAKLVMERWTTRDASEVDALLARNGEQWVPLETKVPVYILYFTAWVERDGTVRFHHDVYGRDEKLRAIPRQASAAAAGASSTLTQPESRRSNAS